MGATTIATVPCPRASWTLIADGAAYGSIGVQSSGAQPVAIAIAGSQPAVGLTDFIVLGVGDPSIVLPLTATDQVWGRGMAGDGVARLYRVGI